MDEYKNTMPTLTLDPFAQSEVPTPPELPKEVEKDAKEAMEETKFSPEEQQLITDFANQIDLHNSTMILQYGAGAQKKIADFSQNTLENVKSQDLGEIGDLLTNVVKEVKNISEQEEQKGLLGFFKKSSNKIENMKIKYDSAQNNIEKICTVLEGHQVQLLKDAAMLDKMYQMNLSYLHELSLYLAAGKKKLAQIRAEELPQLANKAEASGVQEDLQAARDLSSQCERFEKKLYDLDLTRMVSLQMAPQIRLVQNNDMTLSEKIQSTLVNTIPLWKSQMVLALGIANSQKAISAQQQVTQMTNDLLKQNAKTLKMATIETAKETERGIVDIETLKMTNESLLSTLDETMKIQQEGREKRAQAELELSAMEEQMKQKLLEISRK